MIEKYNLVLSSRNYDDYRKKCNSKSLKEVFNEMECDVSEFDNLSLNEYVNTLIKENKNLKEDNFRLNEEDFKKEE